MYNSIALESLRGSKNFSKQKVANILKKKFTCIIPKKLYYITTEEGKYEKYNSSYGSLLNLTYSIYCPKGHCLATQSNVNVDLNNTILGFRLATKSMQNGETRELWIHPSFGYGYEGQEKCIYLKAVVTCNKRNQVVENAEQISYDNEPLNLSFLMDPKLEQIVTDSYHSVLIERGIKLRQLLKKFPTINLEQIVNYLKKLESTAKSNPDQEIYSGQNVVNQILWNIYFSNDRSSIVSCD